MMKSFLFVCLMMTHCAYAGPCFSKPKPVVPQETYTPHGTSGVLPPHQQPFSPRPHPDFMLSLTQNHTDQRLQKEQEEKIRRSPHVSPASTTQQSRNRSSSKTIMIQPKNQFSPTNTPPNNAN